MRNPFSFVRPAAFVIAASAIASAASAGVAMIEYNNGLGVAFSEVAYVNLQFPASFSVTTGASTPTIYGRVYQGGMTEASGPNALIIAQVGYGPIGSNPLVDDSGWTWMNATFNVQYGNDDEYMHSFTAPAPGTYAYTYRFNLNPGFAGAGVFWTLADLNGAGSNQGLNYDPQMLGVMTVTPTPGAAAALGLGALVSLRRRR